jgi:hypothetical protein
MGAKNNLLAIKKIIFFSKEIKKNSVYRQQCVKGGRAKVAIWPFLKQFARNKNIWPFGHFLAF